MHNLVVNNVFDLYTRIEALCKKQGISIAELTRHAGLSKNLIYALKSGQNKTISFDKMIAIADYFEISLDELIGRKKEAPSQKRNEAMDKVIDLFGQMTEEQRELALKIVEQVVLSGIK